MDLSASSLKSRMKLHADKDYGGWRRRVVGEPVGG